MATHSGVLAWRIPGMGEPGALPSMGRTESDTTLPSMGWHRVGHDWSDLAAAAAAASWPVHSVSSLHVHTDTHTHFVRLF